MISRTECFTAIATDSIVTKLSLLEFGRGFHHRSYRDVLARYGFRPPAGHGANDCHTKQLVVFRDVWLLKVGSYFLVPD